MKSSKIFIARLDLYISHDEIPDKLFIRCDDRIPVWVARRHATIILKILTVEIILLALCFLNYNNDEREPHC
jgi:hypothetical protein